MKSGVVLSVCLLSRLVSVAPGQVEDKWDQKYLEVCHLTRDLKFSEADQLTDECISQLQTEAPRRVWRFHLAKAEIAFDMGHYSAAYQLYMEDLGSRSVTTLTELEICCRLLDKPLPSIFLHERVGSYRDIDGTSAFESQLSHFPDPKQPVGKLAELFLFRGESLMLSTQPEVGLQDLRQAQQYAPHSAFVNYMLSLGIMNSRLGDKQARKDEAAGYLHKALQKCLTDEAKKVCNDMLKRTGHYGYDVTYVKHGVVTKTHHPCDCPICHPFNH